MQLKANQASQDSGNRTQAVWILKDLADRMNANSLGLQFYNTGGNYACAVPAKMCAAYFDGDNQDAENCSAQEMAQFDLWELVCPRNFTLDGINVREKSADFISNPVLSIRTDIVNNRATLSLTWDVRTSGSDENGNRLYIIGDDNENRTETLTRQVQL